MGIGKRIGEISKECDHKDGFLHMKLKTENVFGASRSVYLR
jgi:hypothetical protein